MRVLRLIVFVFLVVCLPGHSEATTYYVATTGNDSNGGLDITTPKRTIAHCATLLLAPGDTCYVRGGTYVEGTITLGKSGTQALPIQLLNYPGETPVIDFNNVGSNRINILNSSGSTIPIAWITLAGFEIKNGALEGIKFWNMADSTITRNSIHHNLGTGVLAVGGLRNTVTRNIIYHNGPFALCAAQTPGTSDWTKHCTGAHGLYMNGSNYTITHNLIYDNLSSGIQQNGSATPTSTAYAGTEYGATQNWIIAENTFVRSIHAPGIIVWGGNCDGTRIENNIFYENNIEGSTSNGVLFTSATGSTGILIRNNHSYATAPGGTRLQSLTGATEGVNYTLSGNVVNVSPPALVNGGSDGCAACAAITVDGRLTASAPVNIARVNEFLNNSTLVVGAYKTIANPTGTITTNVITLVAPMSTATPIQNLSTTGVIIGCTGTACPGSPTASTVVRRIGDDTKVDITVNGIAGNACVAADQNWTVTYSSATGSWSANDNVGPYPGVHQKLFSFTSLALTNLCTGSGPTGYPAGAYIYYNLDDNTGTTATNTGSLGAPGNGTLTNGPTWGPGQKNSGVVITGNNTEHVAVPYGNAVNPSSQSLTIAFGVNIPAGNESLSRSYFGAPLGTNQRLYVSTAGSTWRLGIHTSNDGTASDKAVHAGWNHVCLTIDSATDTATLHIDGVASASAGARKTYTSYTLAGDFDIGRLADAAVGGGGGTYDDVLIYTSVENCATIYAVFQASPPVVGGTFAQAAVQAQAVYLPSVGGTPTNLVAMDAAKKVVANGAVAWVFQVHCTNVANCDPTAFRLAYRKNGAGAWQQVPDMETADGIWMFGVSSDPLLNAGATATRLTGSCTVTEGVTLLTSAQVPPVDLPQDGCIMLRWITKVGNVPGDYFELRVETEGGVAFTGSYTLARINVIPSQSGVGQ